MPLKEFRVWNMANCDKNTISWVVKNNIGLIGFGDFKRDIEPSIKGLPEIGWVLASPAHGKGYATEAVKAALAWSDKNLADKETVCIISPDNVGSIRLAEKCGYTESAKATYHGETTLIFRRQP